MNAYSAGSEIVFPLGIKEYGNTGPSTLGTIMGYIPGSTSITRIQWKDGQIGNINIKHIIAKHKFDELTKAGMNVDQVIEYLRVFNGNVYN